MKSVLVLLSVLFSFWSFAGVEIGGQLFVPKGVKADAPLVVAIHGCGQTAEVFSEVTNFNILAKKFGFLVYYPEQKKANNSLSCWNWFALSEQVRELSNEAGQIIGKISEYKKQYSIGSVFVAGLSSGAGMANILTACYPETFKASASVGGLAYSAASSMIGAIGSLKGWSRYDSKRMVKKSLRCSGEAQKIVPKIVFHGQKDEVVHPKNADDISKFFLAKLDQLDNGLFDNSVMLSSDLFQMVKLDEFGHVWTGSESGLPYSTSEGPNMTEDIWSFFKSYL